MAAWKKDVIACRLTWYVLGVLNQSKQAPEDSGDIPVSDFEFWLPDEDLRRTAAKSLAIQLNNVFQTYYGAKYEEGSMRSVAIPAMHECLMDEEMTMADLAEVVNENYRFLGE